MKKTREIALLLAIAASAIGLAACGSSSGAGNPDSKLSADEATAPLKNAPPQLAAIRAQANQILDGGDAAFEARLAALKGTPVVVNKWASWCGPCRLEFPYFQSQAEQRGAEVAFLGDFGNDSVDAGDTFLSELPLPYPSYDDPEQAIADLLEAPQNFPATAFYDRSGELVFTHQGQYRDEQELAADIARYAR
jgi:thiol-disulfide isomerase/thioredoxin